MKTFLNLIILISSVCANDWTYDDQKGWNLLFKQCNGTHESPINIDTTKVRVNSFLNINFTNYEKFFTNATVQNNGHTARVFLTIDDENQMPYISGSAVRNQKFILDSFHFHWGQTDSFGSEHSINGVKRSAELHLVHWNQIYGNMSNARNQSDGLTVVTVFLQSKSSFNFGLDINNKALMPIINALSRITKFSSDTKIDSPLNLNSLLPSDKELFYRYDGSSTTPPCSQTAIFIVFAKTLDISSDQLSKFRQLEGYPVNGVPKPLTHNTREQQKLNDRIVESSEHYSDDIFSHTINGFADVVKGLNQIFEFQAKKYIF